MVPSGKHTENYGKSPFLMGKLTISMTIFNSYVSLPEAISAPKGRVSQRKDQFLLTLSTPSPSNE